MCHRLSLSRRLRGVAPEPEAVRLTAEQSEPDVDPFVFNRELVGERCLDDDLTRQPSTEAGPLDKQATGGRGDEALEQWLRSLGLAHYHACFRASGACTLWDQAEDVLKS